MIETTTSDRTVKDRIDDFFGDASQTFKLGAARLLADKATRTEGARHTLTTAGRVGLRSDQVSELTVIVPLTKDGAHRLRKLFSLTEGNMANVAKVGTLHNMRFVFLDNDTKLLFATAYDGDWDTYIDDFVAKIPDAMDTFFGNIDGWPGIHDPSVKDFIAQYQIPAAAWFVATPELTVVDVENLRRRDRKLSAFIDSLDSVE